ncbi:FemAB family protein [Aquirufa aurantiipilula]
MKLSEYQLLIDKLELTAGIKSLNQNSWDTICAKLDYYPVTSSNSNINFQLEYFSYHQYEIFDLSLILLNDGNPCGIFPLFLKKIGGNYLLDSYTKTIKDPIFVNNVAAKTIDRISKSVFSLLLELKRKYNIENVSLSGSFKDKSISKLQRLFLNSEASISTEFEIYVDLRFTIEEIKSKFRKSYKSLINQGLNIWKVELFDSTNINDNEWRNFKNLHFEVSGRKTRSDETWAMQYRDILNEHSFYISLKNQNEELVGGAYFLITKDEGYYGVAAYRRELFDKPVGHVVQYTAIQHCKELNLKWYKIGERPFKHLNKEVSDKELNIADFKEGFSTDVFPISVYTL